MNYVRRSASHRAKMALLALAVPLFAVEGRSQAYFDWYAKGFWNGQAYEGYSAYSSAQIAYFISSFGGSDNAVLTDSDPGTCAAAPLDPDQVCQFSTSYYVQSSGATPTQNGYMRAFGYSYWLAAPAFSRLEVCANDCVTRRSIRPWELALLPHSPQVQVPLRRSAVNAGGTARASMRRGVDRFRRAPSGGLMPGTKHRGIPAVIAAFKSKAQWVRQAALELGLTFEETSVSGQDDVVKFRFGELDSATTRKLIAAVPRDAYAYRAEIGSGSEPPPAGKRD